MRSWIGLLAAILLMASLAGCGWALSTPRPSPDRPQNGGQNTRPSDASPDLTITKDGDLPDTTEPQVNIHLSEGKPPPPSEPPQPLPVTGSPLTEAEIAAILARLPELPVLGADQQPFKLAQQPIPPPRPGQTVEQPFPPDEPPLTAPEVPSGPLQVLRFSPEGAIDTAPFLSVTFNQPMVALATIEQLAAQQAPVRLEPALEGTWRWAGTRTLTFETDSDLIDRLPKATVYTATIPAGTKSATGGVLAEPVSWTFSTPPARIVTGYPANEPQPLDPLFFISFDQRIDPDAMLRNVHVLQGSQPVTVRLASQAEIEADPQVQSLAENALDGRWLAFRAVEPLEADRSISVLVGPGAPSAEGPLLNEETQSFGFQTYAPLRLVRHGCVYGDRRCRPLEPLFIEFNNPIDSEALSADLLTITPELPGASLNIFGNTIQITGATSGRTTYTVTVSGELQDTFGQKLVRDQSVQFQIGPADPLLVGPQQPLVTLDPAAPKPVFSVYVVNYKNLDVKMYAVQPADWPAFQEYLQNYMRDDRPKPPGRLVWEGSVPTAAEPDALSEVAIDLSEALQAAGGSSQTGHLIVTVNPPPALFKKEDYWQTVQAWVQATGIGLDAFADHSEMVAWASDLRDGAPLEGVTLEAEAGRLRAVTSADGTARFDIPDGARYLTASRGDDTAILPAATYYWGGEWDAKDVDYELRWYVLDDRQMYRPGEEMHVKGWIRLVGGRQDGDVGQAGDALRSVSYSITDAQGNQIGQGQAPVNSLGGFDFAATLPQAVNLGYAQLDLTAAGRLGNWDGTYYGHGFQIQEFRRPEFEVTARNETPGPYYSGGNAVVAVQASYYAGGPLPGAEVTWQVTSTPGHYAPPGWPDFAFGQWQPWWIFDGFMEADRFYPPVDPRTKVETFSGLTDAAGEHFLQLDFEIEDSPQPVSILAEATVMDVNRQAWTGRTDLLVHPADLYVGLRSDRYFVGRGEPLLIDLIVTDLDGNPVSGRPVDVQAARMEWKYQDNQWQEVEADAQDCRVTSEAEPVTCEFETPLGGSYRITAVVNDDQGRQNQSQIERWVSGGGARPARNVERETVTLIPDKETYQPGDTAQVLVQAPFSPAEGLLTVARSGILYTQRFTLVDGSATLAIPIEEAHIPNLNVQVDLAGAAQRLNDQGEPVTGLPDRPAYASGSLNLKIPPETRRLNVQAELLEDEIEPGGETTLALTLTDADGQPVADAELAVVVVDEAVLALSSYQLNDPLSIFYAERGPYLDSYYGRASIVLVDPLALAAGAMDNRSVQKGDVMESAMEAPAAAPMEEADMAMAGAGNRAAPEPIRVRQDFNPLAVFAPAVRTDANGQAQVAVKLPDNLTRYRVMVVAANAASGAESGNKFGVAETNLTARLPLMARPSAPRFLNFGDVFELPVVLQNQTDAEMVVDVAAEASNLVLIDPQTGQAVAAAGLRVTVPARDRVEVRFPAQAQMAGTARIRIAAISDAGGAGAPGAYADSAVVELPVYTPATTEAFAVYGVVDEGAVAQPLDTPAGVIPGYGGLEISTSSTAVQALTDAVLYLTAYPFEGSEQIASRILGVAALRDVLTAFQAEGLPSAEDLEAAVERDIETLAGMQNPDGGFPYWRHGQDSIPFNTIHAAYAMAKAQEKGFAVPNDMQQSALQYLREIEMYYPDWYSQDTRWTLSAYALYVRGQMNDADPGKALRLLQDAGVEKLSFEALGWLWQVLADTPAASQDVDAIRTHINNRAVETAGAANFITSFDEQDYLLLRSNRRSDAILLEALMADDPQHDLIPKLVTGLLAHRTKGRWDNTQENVFVLLALDKYFNTYEAETPDFVARMWLGEDYVGSSEFRGRSADYRQVNVPMQFLLEKGELGDLVLSKDGPGRLYYRLGLRYAPDDLKLDPLEMGFVVQRRYEAVDDPADVTQDADGTWRIKAGARVRVQLTMVADNRRYHVALVDPLPAGLEIVNPELAVMGGLPPDPSQPPMKYGWWWGRWFEHQNLRDERAEAFTSLLWEGVYEYSYIARATTPGTFVVPPAKAEEMYSPEVFGRSGSDVVEVR